MASDPAILLATRVGGGRDKLARRTRRSEAEAIAQRMLGRIVHSDACG